MQDDRRKPWCRERSLEADETKKEEEEDDDDEVEDEFKDKALLESGGERSAADKEAGAAGEGATPVGNSLACPMRQSNRQSCSTAVSG